MFNPQLNNKGNLNHLLSIEGLSKEKIIQILDTAESFLKIGERDVKKVPILRGKTVCNVFFENSTRTRTTFEIAAKRLSADVINLNVATSSQSKGETVLDTINNLIAMNADIFVVRHSSSGAAHFIASHVKPNIHIINAGDGNHSHPTQGLLDAFTIRKYKTNFNNLKVAIVGDILNSRVARSNIHALNILGVPEIRVIAPKTLLPDEIEKLGVHVFYDIDKGLKDADVIMMLRMDGIMLPSQEEYFKTYGLNQVRLDLAKKDAIVMHPGPMNRGVEIDSAVADSEQSVILPQVTFGIAVRMAVMAILAGQHS